MYKYKLALEYKNRRLLCRTRGLGEEGNRRSSCLEACYQERDKGSYLPRLIHMQQCIMN